MITQYPSLFNPIIQINSMTFIKCLDCGEILESTSVHDFVKCSCPNPLFLDGGDNYCRYGGKEKDRFQIIDSTTIHSTTIHSFLKMHYPAYDGEVDDRPIREVMDEIHKKLKKYT